MAGETAIAFDNSYARLPERFYAKLHPSAVQAPKLIVINKELADLLGIDADFLASRAGIEMLSGNGVPDGAEPLAAAYAGHQFGHFVPQLGDGRAVLLGEVIGRDGVRRDIQLKGAGKTPFSRMGDGRAALGPVLREYIVSEAMHAMDIPTTRSLAAVTTGDPVLRETVLPGAILTRVAQSHIRVGTFQFFAARGDQEALSALTDHVMERHFPSKKDAEIPALALLEAVLERQAGLIAKWLGVGFIHGVMNTDNMSIAGETIDYGPCAFLDAYDPQKVFSSVDQYARYAYGNQPAIGQWNLTRLAECLLPLIHTDQDKAIQRAEKVLSKYPDLFQRHHLHVFGQKLGIAEPQEQDRDIIRDFLGMMQESEADFTQTFANLPNLLKGGEAEPEKPTMDVRRHPNFAGWKVGWIQRLEKSSLPQAMSILRQANPAFIPRNHTVEAIIKAAQEAGDFAPFHRLIQQLKNPFDPGEIDPAFTSPPKPSELVHRTFCGT